MAETGKRFTGGDNFEGLHKVYHDIMMKNELRDGKGAYELSYAGKGESGPSLGGNQMDIAQNPDARKALRDIVKNAKDNNGSPILNDIEQDKVIEILDVTKPEENLRGNSEKIFGASLLPKINNAIASGYGVQRVNEVYAMDMKERAKHIENVISGIKDPKAKAFYDSDLGRALLFDYHNQYNFNTKGNSEKAPF